MAGGPRGRPAHFGGVPSAHWHQSVASGGDCHARDRGSGRWCGALRHPRDRPGSRGRPLRGRDGGRPNLLRRGRGVGDRPQRPRRVPHDGGGRT